LQKKQPQVVYYDYNIEDRHERFGRLTERTPAHDDDEQEEETTTPVQQQPSCVS
jgi:hypothetical protein